MPQIFSWLLTYKYIVLFPASIIEGPIVSIIAGFLVSIKQMSLLPTVSILILGDIVGDTLYYIIGRKARGKTLEKYGKYIGLNPTRLASVEKHFEIHPGKTLIIGKLTHAAGLAAIISAGLAKLEFRKFLFYDLISTIPKTIVLIIVGYFFGSAYARIDNALQIFTYVGAGVVTIVVLYLLRSRAKKEVE